MPVRSAVMAVQIRIIHHFEYSALCEQVKAIYNYIFAIECDFEEIFSKKVKNVDKSVDKVDYSNEKGLKILKKLLFAKSRKKLYRRWIALRAVNACISLSWK